MSLKGFRSMLPEFLKYVLSREGSTITKLEQDRGRSISGDTSQYPYRDLPVWHNRTALIEQLAHNMQISTKYWGPKRVSADFHNMVDQEIAKLQRKGVLIRWNSNKSTGILRLIPEHQSDIKPTASMGDITSDAISILDGGEDDLKRTFIAILAHGKKSNTYKFALARSLLEYCQKTPYGTQDVYRIPYTYLADKFLEYYWNQECRFRIKQDFTINNPPKVIQAIRKTFSGHVPGSFDDVDSDSKDNARHDILKSVFGHARSKTSLVVPKFQKIPVSNYTEERKVFYDYDDCEKMLILKPEAFAFFKNNNSVLSRVVLVEWAKFLEKINGSLPRLISKIEQAEAQRESLTRFRSAYGPHTNHCFYCNCKLEEEYIDVDHFLPWSYIFEDEAWNLVLSCRSCNMKKSDSLPQYEFQQNLIIRNENYRDRIGLLDKSLRLIDTKVGWRREIKNHYETCQDCGFTTIHMP